MIASWFQENGSTVLFMVVFGLFVLRGPLLARLFKIESISVHDLSSRLKSTPPLLLVDVRTPLEFAKSHAPGAMPVPLSQLGDSRDAILKKCSGREVAVICYSGSRSLRGAVTLKRMGIFAKVYNVSGGMAQWENQGYPVRK